MEEGEIHDFNLNDIVTPIKVDNYEKLLHSTNYNKVLAQNLIKGFRKGFDIGYRGPLARRNIANNIPLGNNGTQEDLWNKVLKEVGFHRYAGPFYDAPPYEYYIQSPIGLVPKAGN